MFLACGEKAPSDIYFVFDSPYLGGQGSEKCSQFIETVLSQEEMDEGMQVGMDEYDSTCRLAKN